MKQEKYQVRYLMAGQLYSLLLKNNDLQWNQLKDWEKHCYFTYYIFSIKEILT